MKAEHGGGINRALLQIRILTRHHCVFFLVNAHTQSFPLVDYGGQVRASRI